MSILKVLSISVRSCHTSFRVGGLYAYDRVLPIAAYHLSNAVFANAKEYLFGGSFQKPHLIDKEAPGRMF
jgi:hypothetical protein